MDMASKAWAESIVLTIWFAMRMSVGLTPVCIVFGAYDHVHQSCMCSDTDNNLRTKAVPTRPRQTLVNWLLIWILYYLQCLRMLAARSIVSDFYTTRSPLTGFHLPQ